MAIDPSQIKRYAHGSRVPGWDSSVDLTKDPAVVPDPATTYVPAHVRTGIEALMTKYPDIRSAVIPAMKIVQREHGWLSPTAMEQAACVLRLTPAYLVSVASFYDMFELAPKGRTDVYVCTNISCSLLGADELYAHVKDVLGGDPDFNVRAFECLGACEIAPMASVDGVYVGPLATEDVEHIRDDVKEGRSVLPHKQLAKRKAASKHWNR
jgi:NADH-quinone oxidoreductase subunit E